MTRELPTANDKLGETLVVNFSVPSSGHQVLGISRSITYYDQRDQPLISETLAQLTLAVGHGLTATCEVLNDVCRYLRNPIRCSHYLLEASEIALASFDCSFVALRQFFGQGVQFSMPGCYSASFA